MSSIKPCPQNSFHYNSTLCFCSPGHYFLNKNCTLFDPKPSETWIVNTGVDYSIPFPATIFSFDSIKKFTQSQAIFLEATVLILVLWIGFCVWARVFGKLGDGRSVWFRIRWCISRLDVCFGTRHWLDDQKVVVKRKTELGGTLSIASWILFIGLFAALLYQVISKRSIEVHNVRATNAPDLASFKNDMEFNITTVSSMSCSNLRGLGTLITGNPGFIGQRVAPLSNFASYSCQNTSMGPTISLNCHSCQFLRDSMYISWHFVDLPSNPATAVGFHFNLTAKDHNTKKHISFVSGTLKNGSNLDDRPVTFRGVDANLLQFNLFPRIYRNFHNLRLIQPLFHEFIPGSSYSEVNKLQASIESSSDGLINTTLYINFLSDYVIEIDSQSYMGPVGFLADLGGLYCISIGIFYYLLLQCEFRIKRLRNEDKVLQKIRNRRKAQDHWDKLRKYVLYTWGCSTMNADNKKNGKESCFSELMVKSKLSHDNGTTRNRRLITRRDDISLNQKISIPNEKDYAASCTGDTSQSRAFSVPAKNSIPPPPVLEFKADPEVSMSDVQKNLQRMYEYNVLLRDNLIATQSKLHAIESSASASRKENQAGKS